MIDGVDADENELEVPLLATMLPLDPFLGVDHTPMTADSACTNRLCTVFLNATSAIKIEIPRDVMISGLHKARTKRRPSSMMIDQSGEDESNSSDEPSNSTLPRALVEILYILL